MKDPYKNYLHLEPPKGLLNDPNGVSYFKGRYYVFHQWDRFACDHTYKEWGLFTSTDLLLWQHEGSALVPDSFEDHAGVYSGSAVVVADNLQLFYTGNTKQAGKRKSYQKRALSVDGRSYLKYPGQKTPSDLTEHHRDPKIVKVNDEWWMLVGSQTKEAYQGAVALYTSADLKAWTYQGLLYSAKELEQMCECPDLLLFDNTAVLLVCPQKRDLRTDTDISSYSGYYLGELNGQSFKPQSSLQKLDQGFDFYAPQTFKDEQGRYLLWAWMSRMDAQAEKNCPTQKFGYLHCLTLPRVLTLEDGKLYQRPPVEYLHARRLVETSKAKKFEFIYETGVNVLELSFLEPVTELYLELTGGWRLTYQEKILCLERKSWVDGKAEKRCFTLAELKKLELYIDRSALEVFINDGQEVMAARYFNEAKRAKLVGSCQTKHTSNYYQLELEERKDG